MVAMPRHRGFSIRPQSSWRQASFMETTGWLWTSNRMLVFHTVHTCKNKVQEGFKSASIRPDSCAGYHLSDGILDMPLLHGLPSAQIRHLWHGTIHNHVAGRIMLGTRCLRAASQFRLIPSIDSMGAESWFKGLGVALRIFPLRRSPGSCRSVHSIWWRSIVITGC